MVKQVSKFDGKRADDFLGWSYNFFISLSLYHKSTFSTIQGLQRALELDDDQVTTREAWVDANNNLNNILYFVISGPASSVVRGFEEKTQEERVGHGQDAWTALCEKFDVFVCEILRAASPEMETPITFSTRRTGAATASLPYSPRRASRTASTKISSCSAFHESTTEPTRSTLRGRTETL